MAFDAVGDLEQHVGAFGRGGAAPGVLGGVGGVERQFDVFRGRAGDLAQNLAADRAEAYRNTDAVHRRDPFAADEIVELRP